MSIKRLFVASIIGLLGLNLAMAAADPVAQNDKMNDDSIDRINENFRFALTVSPLDMPFPLSAGVSVIYQNDPKWMVELNYLRNLFPVNLLDVETQELGQQHFSVKGHYFIKERYYATIGIGKRFTKSRISNDYLNYNGFSADAGISKFSTDFITVGMGNVFKLSNNLQLNLDWAALNFAFSESTTQSAVKYANGSINKQKVSENEDKLKSYMSHSFLRLTLLGQY